MTSTFVPHFGRPDRQMAKAVHNALRLFKCSQRDAAIALLKKHDVPLPVVERVILQRGPRRRPSASRHPTLAA